MLHVSSLSVQAGSTPILQDLTLTVGDGEIAVLMGPNGSGKSTLANVLAGHPGYEVTGGSIELDGVELLTLTPEERAAAGLFLAFQQPPTIPGVPVAEFLRIASSSLATAQGKQPLDSTSFLLRLRQALQMVGLSPLFAQRSLGDGFSGGEKKRLELLQALVLQPKLVVLDEIDSGLDVDALKLVGVAATHLLSQGSSILVITHYRRLLEQLTPSSVHLIRSGAIAQSGGLELADQIEQHGYR